MRSDRREWRRSWVFVVGHAVAIVGSLVVVVFAGVAIVDAVMSRECPLPALEFEVTDSEVVEYRPFPPRATCRYLYRDGDRDRFPPDVRISDATGATITLPIAMGAFVVALVRLRRWTTDERRTGI